MEEINYLELDRQLSADECSVQAEGSATNGTDTALTDTEVIQSTVVLYIGIFAVLFLLFLFVRPCHPRVYNPKKSFPALRVPVAENSFGRISWMWNVFNVDYEDLREQCGMDAASTVRILEMGFKLSLVGVFNSAFLAPVYSLMGDAAAGDPVKGVSLSNLGQGQYSAVAATVAAYVFFGALMHWVDKDFEWFTSHRHAFLSKRTVPNYSVFLSGLPPEMQTDRAVEEYFVDCFSSDSVVADAHVALVIPNLEKKVAKRDKLVPELEHAINVLTVKGKTPTHKVKSWTCKKVESVPAYEKEIGDLNEEISRDIDRIEALQRERDGGGRKSLPEEDAEAAGDDDLNRRLLAETASKVEENNDGGGAGKKDAAGGPRLDLLRPAAVSDAVLTGATATTAAVSGAVLSGAAAVKSLIVGEDGAPRTAAFVSFSDLASANLARQAVHNEEPWCCVPMEPPPPELVNWKNVGLPNARKQIGGLISLALTAALCIFWTIPVAFVSSFSNVEKLTELLPFLKAPVDNYQWFSEVMAVLAPLILVGFTSLLPYFILFIIKSEGLIEIETMQHPSLFSKLAAFTILQTFFISTISSTLLDSLQQVLKYPTCAIELFARALPAQSAYFIQIIIVQNLLSLGIELLRISPIVQNILRRVACKILGHDLTEKERNETFLGLRSLDDPPEYYFGRELGSKVILLQMVLYVYGCMAPITSYFTLIIFGLLAIGYRHQFIFVYPIANDSGGKLWMSFQRLSLTCAIVAEIVLCVVLFLKESFLAAVLVIPLIVFTILFDLYFKKRHYAITSYLPLGDCAAVDRFSENEGMTNEWLRDAYLQPALKERIALPKNCLAVASAEQREQDEPQANWEEEAALADTYKEKGNSFMSSKQYVSALKQYTKAISASPAGHNTHIYYSNRAAAFLILEEYHAAAEDCKKSIELDATNPKAHLRLGLSLYFQGDYNGAIVAYEKSLDLDPTNEACFGYMVKAKEQVSSQWRDESIEADSPLCGGGICVNSVEKSESIDPSLSATVD